MRSGPLFPQIKRILLATLLLSLAACAVDTPVTSPQQPGNDEEPGPPVDDALSARLLPENGKVLLVIGQDMGSVSAYVKSNRFPTPGGVTTYVAFYQLLSTSFPAFGALGENARGTPLTYDINWGAGRLNAHSAAHAFPDSTLVIGLSLAEGSGESVWASGELARIGAGHHDDKIRRLAKFCRDTGVPVYLRIGYEFDGAWNRGYENQANYIAAFRRIVEVMRTEGADRVAFVWQASASPIDDLIEGRREDIRAWYPGDDYVDWLGLSWFLPPDDRGPGNLSPRELADEVLMLARQRRKPVMIAEASPQGYDLEQLTRANISPIWDGPAGESNQSFGAGQIWQTWFAPFFDYVRENADIIRAVAYINADWDAQSMWASPYPQGYWGDSRVEANPEISRYWNEQLTDESFWLHGSADIGQRLRK